MIPGSSEKEGRRPIGQNRPDPRGKNEQADRLAKAALAEHMITHGNVLSFVQLLPLIDSGDVQEIGSESN